MCSCIYVVRFCLEAATFFGSTGEKSWLVQESKKRHLKKLFIPSVFCTALALHCMSFFLPHLSAFRSAELLKGRRLMVDYRSSLKDKPVLVRSALLVQGCLEAAAVDKKHSLALDRFFGSAPWPPIWAIRDSGFQQALGNDS